jgi:glycosyltransferase 2 family protein
LLPGLVISLVSLVIILYLIEPEELVKAIQRADYSYVLAGVVVTFVWLAVRATAWRTLLRYQAKLTDVFLALCEGYLMNNLLPFRLGEIGRIYLLGRKAGLDFWQVLPTVIIERALDVALGAGLFLGTLPFVVGVEWAQQAALGTMVLIGLSLFTLIIMAKNREAFEAKLNRLAQRVPILNRLMGKRLPAFLDGLSILASPSIFFPSLGWIVLNWGLGILQFFLYIRAFFPEGQLLWAAFSLGALALGVTAPSTPGNLGVYELALVSALALFTGNASQAAALALTIHALQYVITGLPGAYGLFREGESLASLFHKVRNLRQA